MGQLVKPEHHKSCFHAHAHIDRVGQCLRRLLDKASFGRGGGEGGIRHIQGEELSSSPTYNPALEYKI